MILMTGEINCREWGFWNGVKDFHYYSYIIYVSWIKTSFTEMIRDAG